MCPLPSPRAFAAFEAELLKPDAAPACGSRFSRDTLLDGRSSRKYNKSTGSPCPEQSSVLGSWLDFSIHRFHFELQRPCRRTRGTLTPGYTQLHEAHQHFRISVFQRFAFVPSVPSRSASICVHLWLLPFHASRITSRLPFRIRVLRKAADDVVFHKLSDPLGGGSAVAG
jgi:hypothetical protein